MVGTVSSAYSGGPPHPSAQELVAALGTSPFHQPECYAAALREVRPWRINEQAVQEEGDFAKVGYMPEVIVDVRYRPKPECKESYPVTCFLALRTAQKPAVLRCAWEFDGGPLTPWQRYVLLQAHRRADCLKQSSAVFCEAVSQVPEAPDAGETEGVEYGVWEIGTQVHVFVVHVFVNVRELCPPKLICDLSPPGDLSAPVRYDQLELSRAWKERRSAVPLE